MENGEKFYLALLAKLTNTPPDTEHKVFQNVRRNFNVPEQLTTCYSLTSIGQWRNQCVTNIHQYVKKEYQHVTL